ncbi:MAG: hypothetical protein JSU86_08145 [Phycisphaerales bacterium]|nr:MAG: hypothetical protein JSU86_08145 [Phycisphaerales bacterium]
MRTLSLLAVFGLLALLSGCPPTGVEPSPEAVLAGEWDATDQDGKIYVLQFNSEGILVRITGTHASGTEQSMSVIGSTSTVDGSAVTVRVPHPEEWSVFTGTLSSDQNRIDGDLVVDTEATGVYIGDVLITIPRGPFVLVRR